MKLLLTTIAQCRAFIIVQAQMEYDQLKPYIRVAQRDQIIPALGAALVKRMTDHQVSAESGTVGAILDELVDNAQDALINFAMRDAIPDLSIDMSAAGLQAVAGDGMRELKQWEKGDLQNMRQVNALSALDACLELLEQNASRFSEWTSSSAYTVASDTLIRRADQFHRYVPINNSRTTFYDLRGPMRRAQKLYIENEIGSAFLAELMRSIDSSDTTATWDAGVESLRQALAPLTIATAKELQFRFDGSSMLTTRMVLNQTGKESAASNSRPNEDGARRKAMEEQGIALLEVARTFFDENASTFPTYRNSPFYRNADARGVEQVVASRLHTSSNGAAMMV